MEKIYNAIKNLMKSNNYIIFLIQAMSESQAADGKTQQQAQNYVDLASGNLDLNPGATPNAEAQNYVNFAMGKMDLNDSQGEGGGGETPQNDSNSKSE